MNRTELIEQIKEYYDGTMHESIQDYIRESNDRELKFFLWQLQNNYTWYDGDDRYINTETMEVFSRESLQKKYEAKPLPIFQRIIDKVFK